MILPRFTVPCAVRSYNGIRGTARGLRGKAYGAGCIQGGSSPAETQTRTGYPRVGLQATTNFEAKSGLRSLLTQQGDIVSGERFPSTRRGVLIHVLWAHHCRRREHNEQESTETRRGQGRAKPESRHD